MHPGTRSQPSALLSEVVSCEGSIEYQRQCLLAVAAATHRRKYARDPCGRGAFPHRDLQKRGTSDAVGARMSGFGGEAEILRSTRALPVLTRTGPVLCEFRDRAVSITTCRSRFFALFFSGPKAEAGWNMDPLLKEFRHNPMLWLLALVPGALVAAKLVPAAHTLLFVLSVLAIVPLAALLSHATGSVAEKTGDTAGGLLNATLGNLTELVIAAAALRAGEYALVKGTIAGAIVTNTLFMLGASFVLGGLKHHIQEYNRATAGLHAGLLL